MTPPANQTESSTSSGSEPPTTASASGNGLSIAAVVLGLAAVVAAGYALWQLQSIRNLPQQVASDAGKSSRQYNKLEQQLKNVSAQAQANAATLADLQAALTEEVAATADAGMQFAKLEQRITAMNEGDGARRKRFLRAEALYYLRLANAQVMLARDADVGATALELADEKLRQAGDPELTPVRARLGEEITALRAVPKIDTAGISFRLQALAGQVSDWPLRNPVPESFKSDLPVISKAPEESAWSRLQTTVQAVINSIVRIRQNDTPPDVQLSQTEQALLIESIRSELQLARLTLISGNLDLYAQSLQRLQQELPVYFDMSASSLQAALNTLNELAAIDAPAALPDISGSLQLLLVLQGEPAEQPSQGATQP